MPIHIFFKRLSGKLRYNGVIRIVQNGFIRVGINITPFYLFLEKTDQIISKLETNKFSDCTVDLLNEKDISTIAKLAERPISLEKLLKRLSSGCICFGVKKGEKLLAFTWYNFNECPFEGCRFKLKENEAYVFDTYTLIDYRGSGLAPFMRYQSSRELKKRGIIDQYSVVEALNKQSLNLKKKLDGRFVLSGLYIKLFEKWNYSIVLKNFM